MSSHGSRKRGWEQTLLIATVLFLTRIPSSSSWTLVVQPRSRQHPICSRSALYSTPSPLEKCTVKELRQMLKDNELTERGLASKLKRKQDLIKYLQQHLPSSNSNNVEETPVSTPKRKPSIRKMPPLETVPPASTALEQVEDDKANKEAESSPKDTIFEKVYQRYPPLRQENFTALGDGDLDIRQKYHPMLANASYSDMEVTFLGTASCTPGVTRGVSCTAIRLNWKRRVVHPVNGFAVNGNSNKLQETTTFVGGTWLFDVGEATQLQVQRTSGIKPGKITKIFLTHAHGDHTFGLPGLLCLMGRDRDRDAPPVDIYGPEGLRMWLRIAIRYSVARIVPHYRVHEIMDVPMAPEWEKNRRTHRYFFRTKKQKGESWGTKGLAGEDPTSWITRANHMQLEPSAQYGELDGGRDIFPLYNHPKSCDRAPVWELEDEDDVKVYAAPMSHGVPCLGYVVEEQERPGRLRNELVEPIVRRNLSALRKAGFKVPMKAMAMIKNMPEGSSFTFPDGTVVSQSEAVEPPRDGRKVVICGDTADARSIAGLAEGADLVVHEATNTYLPGVDRDTNLRFVTKDAKLHGHSTPYMAGEFAKQVGAKRLVLNHFSARYKGDQSVDSISIATRIERQAIKASDLDENCVAAAWDLMVMPIPQN